MAELIVALDFPDAGHALRLADALKLRVRWVKVGLELFISSGPDIVRHLKEMGFSVFLDLKLYDIPNTAEQAALAIARLGADMLTVHCQGGRRMCACVAKSLAELFSSPPLVIGVTVLTSFTDGEMPGIELSPLDFGLELTRVAADSGLDGVVCSAREAGSVKGAYPELICVCPGIRPLALARDDQSRVAGPCEAARAGADYLVVGRPITASPEPVAAAEAILAEINC